MGRACHAEHDGGRFLLPKTLVIVPGFSINRNTWLGFHRCRTPAPGSSPAKHGSEIISRFLNRQQCSVCMVTIRLRIMRTTVIV